jgi:hypothetical protein
MEKATTAQELYGQFTEKALETMSLWAEANQRVFRDLVEFGAGAAREGARVYADLSRAGVDAMREGQATVLRWQAAWAEAGTDPGTWYQKVVSESVSGAEQAFRRLEEGAQALTRSAERVQASAEQVGKAVQETVAATVAKVKEQYTSR